MGMVVGYWWCHVRVASVVTGFLGGRPVSLPVRYPTSPTSIATQDPERGMPHPMISRPWFGPTRGGVLRSTRTRDGGPNVED